MPNTRLFAVLACTFAATACAQDSALKPLQGAWKLTAAQVGDRKLDLPSYTVRLVIDGNLLLQCGNTLAKLSVDASSTPATLDLQYSQPEQTVEGIYELKGDMLKICVAAPRDGSKERPVDFSTADQPSHRLLVLEREPVGRKDADEEVTGTCGFTLMVKQDKLLLARVPRDFPAAMAGLRSFDELLAVDGTKVADSAAFFAHVEQKRPGSEVRLSIRRDGKAQEVAVKMGVPFSFAFLRQ